MRISIPLFYVTAFTPAGLVLMGLKGLNVHKIKGLDILSPVGRLWHRVCKQYKEGSERPGLMKSIKRHFPIDIPSRGRGEAKSHAEGI